MPFVTIPTSPSPSPRRLQLSPLHAAVLSKPPPSPSSPSLTLALPQSYPYPQQQQLQQPSYPSVYVPPRRVKEERPFSDPYGTRARKAWLLFETSFGLSVLEPWEKALFRVPFPFHPCTVMLTPAGRTTVTILFVLLSLLSLGVYELPSNALFLARRAGYYIVGEEGIHLPVLLKL